MSYMCESTLSSIVSTYVYGAFDCVLLSITYSYKSTLYSCLNVKQLLVQNRHKSEVYVTASGFEPTTT